MKEIKITTEEIANTKPEDYSQYAVASVGGSTDVYVFDGNEIMKMYREFLDDPANAEELQANPNPTLWDAIKWYTSNESGNSMEILKAHDGQICKLSLYVLFK